MTADNYMLSVSQIFTLFFIMLGPLRLIIPFSEITHDLDRSQRTDIALKSCGIALLSLFVGAVIGKALLFNWHVEVPVMMLATGIVFFLSGLIPLIYRAKPSANPAAVKVADPGSIAFNLMITPFGMGAAIVLMASSQSWSRSLIILLCILGNILLDLLIMIYSGDLLKKNHRIGMQVLSISLGILGVALGLEIIVQSLRLLKG
jgi:multiple antibiotic resistance protein